MTASPVTLDYPVATLNLHMVQGETFHLEMIWKDSTSTPVNLTGYTGRMQIRKKASSDDVLKSLTSGSGITLGTTNGKIEIDMTASGRSEEHWKDDAVYDFEIVTGSTVKRLFEGTITMHPEVTR